MKRARLLLLAAAPLCCAGLMSATALAATAPGAWSDLWRTPDQQAQSLLDAGQPAQAAERFHDPRLRAYAELQAGRYQDAAKVLAPYTDAESEYNRGNALAESGQLRMALAAYDAALEQTPADRDIRHNRDLVARALHQQQQSQQSSSPNGGKGGQGAPSSGKQSQQSAGRQGGSGSQQPGGAGRQGGAPGSQAESGGQPGANGSQPGSYQQGNSPTDPNSYASAHEGPGQARSDAAFAAALARKQQQRGGPGNTAQGQRPGQNGTPERAPKDATKGPASGSLVAGGTQTPRQEPKSEQQLALDQWLRQIPDSPAGLLQRKFLIEHMMKQQEGDESQDSGASQGTGP
ncbi:MAG TPA: tetratricopeptide repeat protein [Steroidobacteraceae bacterium]|nr:tetratricopeptide repeat protein [Steroidobacteraceae bacterium]